jgi:multiple sugar transport system permease protein
MSKKSEFKSFMERNKKTNGYLLRKASFNVAYKIVRFVLLFGLCFLILQPILNKISVSFMEEKDLYDSTINVIPRNFTLSNYKIAGYLMDYWKALGNTTMISLLVSILQIISCTLVGYGFARYKFPLKGLWFGFVILVIIIPPSTIQSSLYLNFRYFDILGIFKLITGEPLNLLGTITPYALMCLGCMGLKSGLYIYMLRQFFRGIPKELEEAAYVDGCGKVRTFVRIMLPDAKPMITSCFLFSFVWQWTDNFYSRMFLQSDFAILSNKLTGLSGALDSYLDVRGIAQKATTAYSNAMIGTGTLLMIIPLIIVYLFAQKGFVESLSQSGIKM